MSLQPLGKMTCRRWGVVCLASSWLVAGCSSREQTDLLEAHLRKQQDRIVAYERQVGDLSQQLSQARAETDQLRRDLVATGGEARQEVTEPLSRVVSIRFNTLMTGARDSDGAPGHDVVTAVLTPQDEQGDLVKLGGELELELVDLSRPADQRQIGHWKYSADEARRLWHSGFMASGFQMDMPVAQLDINGEVLLHGKLRTVDGRLFESTTPLKVTSAVALSRQGASQGTGPARLGQVSNPRPMEAPSAGEGVVRIAGIKPASGTGNGLQPAVYVKDFGTGERMNKPVPAPQDLPESQARPMPSRVPEAARTDSSLNGASADHSQPRPFPVLTDIQTSDVWTDATIPVYR